jgi:hypothetical protein
MSTPERGCLLSSLYRQRRYRVRDMGGDLTGRPQWRVVEPVSSLCTAESLREAIERVRFLVPRIVMAGFLYRPVSNGQGILRLQMPRKVSKR